MADRVMTDRVVTADHRLSQISTASSTNSKRAKAHIGPWQLGRTLGRGSSGRVRLAKHMESGKLAAVKIVPKSHIMDQATTSVPKASESYGIEREVIIMKLIEHPNIMGLYDVWENKGELYLVLEYIEGGELFDYLISRGRLSEREAIHYFRQICYGVDYCHRFNICHRDLKPENLLLDKHRNIKIADFGMAALEANGRLLETSCGSPHYASPEIVSGKTYHGAPSDIWSCGIILFALLSGHLPFDHDNIRQLLLKVQAGKFTMPSSLSIEARDLISRMLVVDPLKRITMHDILRHPLLQKYPPRKVPTENLHHRLPKVDVTQPIERIDREILRNLLILWHHDTKDSLVARLREPEPNAEKTFYSLLLRFRQRHGLASRDSLPHHRSVASIRSIRSSKSVRSLASLNSKSGSMRSLKSVRSNRSGRSLLSSRRTRRSPVKHHGTTASAHTAAAPGAGSHKNRTSVISTHKPVQKEPAQSRDNADVFAQLLDQVFNNQQAGAATTNDAGKRDTRAFSHPASTTSSVKYGDAAGSRAYAAPPPEAERSKYNAMGSTAWNTQAAADVAADRKRVASEPLHPYSHTVDLAGGVGPNPGPSQPEHNYLLPMIFEEDRFADAIEEEVELKVYKRGASQPRHPRRNANAPRRSVVASEGNSGDISQLHITNLVAGESFLSYQPSQAAASVTAPLRPAPRAPSGPRVMPDRKPVPVYVEEDEHSSHTPRPDTGSNSGPSAGRTPLAPLNADDLRRSQTSTNQSQNRAEDEPRLRTNNQARSLGASRDVSQADAQESLHVPKRGTTASAAVNSGTARAATPGTVGHSKVGEKHEPKKSWIRRLTPRLGSRKIPENARPAPATLARERAGRAPEQTSRLREQSVDARPPQTSVDKENALPYSQQQKRYRAMPQRAVSSEEPKQNWFMKLLTNSAQVSSRTLMSTCQPIELRAIILEVINEWMPHGLALYNDGVRGDPIIVSILRSNSLHLKPARIGIEISPSRSSAASARLVHQKGSRTSFMTFAGEMERRLGDNNVLGVDY